LWNRPWAAADKLFVILVVVIVGVRGIGVGDECLLAMRADSVIDNNCDVTTQATARRVSSARGDARRVALVGVNNTNPKKRLPSRQSRATSLVN